jgi:hypothetical protein
MKPTNPSSSSLQLARGGGGGGGGVRDWPAFLSFKVVVVCSDVGIAHRTRHEATNGFSP